MQFRIDSGYFSNLKIRKLQRHLGDAGVVAHLRLFCYTAEHRPGGSLDGMTTEDVEAVVDWRGEAGAFITELISLRLLDEVNQTLTVHGWTEHNLWVSESAGRREHALLLNHLQHHVQKGVVQPTCKRCQPESVTEAAPSVTDSATDGNAPANVSPREPSAELQALAVEYNALRLEWGQRKVRESILEKFEARFEACSRAMCRDNPGFTFSELLRRVRQQSEFFRDKWPRWDLDWLLGSKRDVPNAARVWSLEYTQRGEHATGPRAVQVISDDVLRTQEHIRQHGGAQ